MGSTRGPNYKPPKPQPISQAMHPNHQQTAWEPVIDSSSTKDEQTAAGEYTATYGGKTASAAPSGGPALLSSYTYPDLSMAYYSSPDLVPTSPGDSSGTGGIDPATVVALDPVFNVDLGALLSTEQTLLNTTDVLAGEYELLKTTVASAISGGTIFGQNAGYQQQYDWSTLTDGFPNQFGTEVVYDDLDKESIAFANSMSPQMELLLKQIANLIEAIGQYDALFNNAGQLYAYTDSTSAFPPAVTSVPTAPPLS